MFPLVALVASAVLSLAIVKRPERPIQSSLPAPFVTPSRDLVAATRFELPTLPPVQVRLGVGGRLELEAEQGVEGADLLLYWTPSVATSGMPEEMALMGPFGGHRTQQFVLPESAQGGSLLLVSLGHRDIVARVALPVLGEQQ